MGQRVVSFPSSSTYPGVLDLTMGQTKVYKITPMSEAIVEKVGGLDIPMDDTPLMNLSHGNEESL